MTADEQTRLTFEGGPAPTDEQEEAAPHHEDQPLGASDEEARYTAEGAPEPAETPLVMSAEELLGDTPTEQASEATTAEANLRAVIEATIYVTEDPLTI